MKKLLRSFIHHVFIKKITIAKWQLNLFAIFLVSVGFGMGSYMAITGMSHIFAASSPWTQTTWASGVGSSTVNQYSAGSNIDATTTSGEVVLSATEQFSNTGFESDLTGWSTGVSPASISGLLTWFKADAITGVSNGAFLSQWNDSSGNANNLTQSGGDSVRPTYVTNALNSLPVVRFDGSNDYMSLGTRLTTVRTFFVVNKWTDTSTLYLPLFGDSTNYPYHGSGCGTTADKLFSDSGCTSALVLNGAGRFNGASTDVSALLRNTSYGMTSVVQTGATDIYYISNDRGNGRVFPGDTAEIILYSSTLSSSDVSRVENYLRDKYAITVSSGITSVTRDTTTKYAGAASAKLVTSSSTGGEYTQLLNVGNTNSYSLAAYVYTDGSAVTSSDAELYANGATVSTTFTSVGSGWYRMSATVTGTTSSVLYGVQVKANKTVYIDNMSLLSYPSSGTLTSAIFDAGGASIWGTLTYSATTPTNTTISVKVRTGNQANLSDASAFSSCSAVSSGADITSACAANNTQYAQYQVTFTTSDATVTPTFSDISLAFITDTTAPTTNASGIAMAISSGGRAIASNGWNNATTPYFSWTAGADNVGGSGLMGYCVYLGSTVSSDPSTTSGLLTNSPVSTTGTTCGFITSSTSLDLSSASYLSSSLASGTTYYVYIKAIDNGLNTFAGASASFQFRHDSTAPTNVTSISSPGSSFSNVADMYFSWPISGGTAASDANSGVLGYQYQINSSSGTWLGTQTDSTCGLDYIPAATSTYALTALQDGASITTGNNTIYFRTIDTACSPSSSGTYRTGLLLNGGEAPTFGGSDTVTVTPSSSTSNSFALSWPTASPSGSNTISHYYYMINTTPPSSLTTLQGNASTYIDNGTSRTVSATALTGVNKGSNTVYVVAIDDNSTPNYSASNYISGTFTLNSSDPDNVGSLQASDSSIKSQSQWNVTLTWTAPSYTGAGNLTYLVYRSTDGSSYSQVGTTTGLSYVDSPASSRLYYYKVYSKDGANATSSGTNAVSITPTGKWTSAPSLDTTPSAGSITTSKATITWSTSRSADSKISYGTTSGDYGTVEPSSSTQTTSHSIQLTGLNPGTTYYYKAKWTDEDGNTGTSDQYSFTTSAAPTVKDVVAKNIGLSTAILQFTSVGASSVKIYYGTTTSFGGSKTISTSTSETTYSAELTGMSDGTKYYYKINTFDSDGKEYEGTTLDLTTLPRPRISNVRIQQVSNTAQSTLLISWNTNTEVSSIVTYYPEDNPTLSRDEVAVELTKGEHQMLVRGLFPQTTYVLIVRGRDKIGNEAVSDRQRLTTATDTRPPQISKLHVEGSNVPAVASSGQESTAQLIVSWNTDEPATSQVEFAEGTGSTYSQKTQEDSNLTLNHLVIISGLTPSKVYHLRALSKDKASNGGNSIDTVMITPKSTENALNLVITNLQQAFGFLGGLKQ